MSHTSIDKSSIPAGLAALEDGHILAQVFAYISPGFNAHANSTLTDVIHELRRYFRQEMIDHEMSFLANAPLLAQMETSQARDLSEVCKRFRIKFEDAADLLGKVMAYMLVAAFLGKSKERCVMKFLSTITDEIAQGAIMEIVREVSIPPSTPCYKEKRERC
jgi:hypothetical protein